MTFWRLYYHLTWATQNREPLIQPDMEEQLYAYLVRKAAELDVYIYAVNGWYDHSHLVAAIPPKQAVAEVVKHLKGASAHYVNHDMHAAHFQWQRGYGALTLGEKQKSAAIAYVQGQKQHHQQHTTNAWLERAAEFDEGPFDHGLLVEHVLVELREARAEYDVLGEPPF